MRFYLRSPWIRIGGGAGAAAVLLVLAALAQSPEPKPTPQASPTPAPSASPAPETGSAAAAQEEALPRILRTVCTDHVCGGCDGKCRKSSGHVAIDKKGHCACTPTAGSALDRAIRGAYERRPPQ